MSVTHPTGLACRINRTIVFLTALLSVFALLSLILLNSFYPSVDGHKDIVYGTCLFTCSFFSYLYNVRFPLLSASILRRLDHAAIFLLIAGTYTPFAIENIRSLFGISLLYLTWGLAITGIGLRLIFRERYNRMFIGLYLMFGWLFLTALPDILRHLPSTPLLFLAAGAVVYSVGAAIFARDIGRWTDPVWHACVLCASALHFMAVLALRASHNSA